MRSLNFRKLLLGVAFVCTAGVLFTGCGKSKVPTPGSTGSIDEAVGTFKGTLKLYPPNSNSQEYFDAIVTVSGAGSGQLKVAPKQGEAYSIMTPKTFKVETQSSAGMAVMAVAGSIEGGFLYKKDIKTLNAYSEQQSATETIFFFEGTKQ